VAPALAFDCAARARLLSLCPDLMFVPDGSRLHARLLFRLSPPALCHRQCLRHLRMWDSNGITASHSNAYWQAKSARATKDMVSPSRQCPPPPIPSYTLLRLRRRQPRLKPTSPFLVNPAPHFGSPFRTHSHSPHVTCVTPGA
jgi:hypothetical protein